MFEPQSEFVRQAERWGYLAGLWHDLGKFSPIWQAYLRRKAADLHSDDANQREDHSSAGAIHAQNADRWGELLAYLIAGHHAGLDNGENLFQVRLPGRQAEWAAALTQAKAAGFPLEDKLPMPPLGRADAGSDGLAFLMRSPRRFLANQQTFRLDSTMFLRTLMHRNEFTSKLARPLGSQPTRPSPGSKSMGTPIHGGLPGA